jgi:PAS domain-containing protein
MAERRDRAGSLPGLPAPIPDGNGIGRPSDLDGTSVTKIRQNPRVADPDPRQRPRKWTMHRDDVRYDFDAPEADWNFEPPPAAVFRTLNSALYVTDAEGWLTYYTEAAAELWGRRPVLGAERWCGSWRIYRTDGTPLPHARCPMAIALSEGRPVRGVEALLERPDGVRVRFLPNPTPLRDRAGTLVGGMNLLLPRA